jgi:hypothetical protein
MIPHLSTSTPAMKKASVSTGGVDDGLPNHAIDSAN